MKKAGFKKLFILSLALCLTSKASIAFSQIRYTMEDLQQHMEENNPELLSLQEEYRRSRLDVHDAWGGLGPSVDLQFSGTYMFNPPVDALYLNVDELLNSISWPSGVRPSSNGQYVKVYDGMEPTLYNFHLSITQPLFTWGKLTNAVILYTKISSRKKQHSLRPVFSILQRK